MDEKGVYAIARSIWDDEWFNDEPYTEREAWMWLLGNAAWKEVSRRGNTGKVITLARAEFSVAIRYLQKKWGWENKDRVHRFLKRLEKRDAIRDTSRDGSQVYIILKYNEFQVIGLPKRDTDATPSATQVRQECDKEETFKHSNKEEDKKRAPALRVVPPKPLPDWMPKEAWSGYLAMRRKARKPPTERAVDLVIAKLERFVRKGHDPTQILDQSTQNNWTDIYEPRAERHGQRKQSPHETAYNVARDYCAEILAGGQGAEGGGSDEIALALLPAGSNRSPN